MLLPSALPCDGKAQQGMVSPPASPPKLSSPATFHIVSSCFSLQNLIANTNTNIHTAAAENQPQQYRNHEQQQQQHSYFGGALPPPPPPSLLSPPMAHAPAPSPMKLRLRIPRGSTTGVQEVRRGIVKRNAPAPRCHKRTLSAESSSSSSSDRETTTPSPPSTPKRSRIAPARVPLGLERSDFHGLHEASLPQQPDANNNNDNDWTAEDDRMLVELVLEKLRLSKADWQDCARSLGKDRHALSRRWKSLVLDDEVGLKRRRIHSTWR